MANTSLPADNTRQRIIELLAEGTSTRAIIGTLMEEGHPGIGVRAVNQHIHFIASDPVWSRKLDVQRRAVGIRKASWLIEIAEDALKKVKDVADDLYARCKDVEYAGNPKTVDALEKFMRMWNMWWKDLSKVHGLLETNKTEINLTQVNIGQVNAVNGQLLSVIQDFMRILPVEQREKMYERLEAIDVEPEEFK